MLTITVDLGNKKLTLYCQCASLRARSSKISTLISTSPLLGLLRSQNPLDEIDCLCPSARWPEAETHFEYVSTWPCRNASNYVRE